MLISKEELKDLLTLFVYKILLDFTYIKYQSVIFAYYGFGYEWDIGRYALGWIIFLTALLFIRTTRNSVGELFVITIYLLSIVPFIVIYQFDINCKLWMLVLQVVCIVGMDFVINRAKPFKVRRIKGVNYKSKNFRIVTIMVLLLYFIFLLMRFRVPNLSSLMFESVYDTRSAVNLSTLESIAMNVICKIACPLFLLIAYKEKQWVWFIFAFVIQVYSYAVTGFKTYLFIPLVLIGLQKMPKLNIKRTIIWGLPLIVLFVDVVYMITQNNMYYAIIMNRVFFLPARIKYCYFDYFSQHDFVYFTQNSISKIFGIKSNYSINVMNLIGAEYFNKPSMWTNTGFMADAYANGGIIGVILIALILYVVMVYLKNQLQFVPDQLQKPLQAIFLLFFISLNDGAAISVLFSGGFLVAIMLVSIVKFEDFESGDNGLKYD